MRMKEMHPLCCISLESAGIGDESPDIAASLTRARSLPVGGNAGCVAGVLYKWTNYGKGWRSRWFLLKNGFLSYSKTMAFENDDVRVIGEMPSARLDSGNGSFRRKVQHSGNTNKSVHLKITGGLCRVGHINRWVLFVFEGLSKIWYVVGSRYCTYVTSSYSTDPIFELSDLHHASSFPFLIPYSIPLSFLRHYLLEVSIFSTPSQISSFRESKSDDRKFYIFTATKTLHLRTDSKRDKVAWIQALVSTRSLFPSRSINDGLSLVPNNLSVSTERLKNRLLDEGINENLVRDCEQIMLSEFSEIKEQITVLCDERSNLLDTLRQLEAANIEAEASGIPDSVYQLTKHEFSSLGREKYSEYSTTESSDDIEKRELEEVSDEDETCFYDTTEYFTEPTTIARGSIIEGTDFHEKQRDSRQFGNGNKMNAEQIVCSSKFPRIERRSKLPDPVEKEKGVSLWSMIKDNVGKDLTRVCLPVYFNEPISSLQKCFEDLEYSYLLDRAYEYGKSGNSLLRILNVAAFAVSGYASSEGRHCKPFNPLLGETYEADYPDKGVRFFSEKVSHHPTLIACHCQGRGWKFWGDSNLRTKFWGRSIQLDPVGILTVEFDDGETFQWSKVTTTIYNLILGKIYCDHHGIMNIQSNREYSCKLKFKEQSILDRNPHQVQGFVEDVPGKKVATVFGKWNECLHYYNGDGSGKPKDCSPSSSAMLLWKSDKPPPNLTRYNLTSFAITLNELTPGLKEKLPPTDSRLRPDQRHLENGEYEKANAEKQRLEKRQRMSRKMQENGWKPRWFRREGEDGPFLYAGGYWEARERGNWDGCPQIFGEFNELAESSEL